ncbi:MAG: M20/M25/M40 family metallo-hydrolase [bacterium]|nr:M20/M25/M40 family metallo-hydrolase [bacterium]
MPRFLLVTLLAPRFLSLVLLGLSLLTSPLFLAIAQSQSSLPDEALSSFDPTLARKHLDFLASDAMRGRNTPSPELNKAAEYISDRFDDADVESVNGIRLHEYTLLLRDLKLPTTLTFFRGKDTLRCAPRADFVPFEYTGENTINDARVVAVGFGITAPEYNYDDYKGLNVEGAVVLVIRGEPSVKDSAKGFRGKAMTRHASPHEKIQNAKTHGAIAVLIVDSPSWARTLSVKGHQWPALFPEIASSTPSVSMKSILRNEPVLHVGPTIVSWLFDSLAGFTNYALRIDSTLETNSHEFTGVTASCHIALRTDSARVSNVVGMVRGSEFPDEYVVVGAHYDHIGVEYDSKKTDSIYNGADDNASGVAGLLMVADALAKSEKKPKRSVLFIAFSGEERGLYGSAAYVERPLLPLDKCVAMINMDMIGRCENNKLSIGGSTRCPDLASLNETENAKSVRPLKLAYDIEQYFFRSDQANFAKHKIPVIFYFTGEHTDYHQLGDEIHKINFTGLTDIARIAAGVVWQAASRPRSTYIEKP